MSACDGSPAEMPIVPSQADWLSPDAETAERLLSGLGADPGAPADQQALALVLGAAARPATLLELSGEQAAVAAFVAVAATSGPRAWTLARVRTRPKTARHPLARRISVAATSGVLAVAVALGGTAAAGELPTPLQRVAHEFFGAPAPAPGPAAPLPSQTRKSPRLTPVPSASPADGHAKQKARTTAAKGKGRSAAKARKAAKSTTATTATTAAKATKKAARKAAKAQARADKKATKTAKTTKKAA